MMPQRQPPHTWAQQQQQLAPQQMIQRYGRGNNVATPKIIRNKQSGQPVGYGFIEFRSRAGAENALQTYNGTPMPSSDKNFRLNWATLGAPNCFVTSRL
ncbi:polyadenylate-binding protein RBP45-like protein isoform X1 [Tanacetum coccineum]